MGQGSSAFRPPTDSFLLVTSVTEGNSDIVALFLRKNPGLIHTVVQDRNSLLHLAAQHGRPKVIQVLINAITTGLAPNGVPLADIPKLPATKYINQQNAKGQTPLAVACEAGHEDCVLALLAIGADVWIADSVGKGPIHYAALNGRNGCMQLLLDKYQAGLPTSHSSSSLDTAAAEEGGPQGPQGEETNGGEATKRLSKPGSMSSRGGVQGGSTASARLASLKDSHGITPLHCAVLRGHISTARKLLEAGAPMAAQTTSECLDSLSPCTAGSTPLHLAALRGDRLMIIVLLHHHVTTTATNPGPVPDPRAIRDSYGHEPYGLASLRRHHALLELLDSNSTILTDISFKEVTDAVESGQRSKNSSPTRNSSIDHRGTADQKRTLLHSPSLNGGQGGHAGDTPSPFTCPITGTGIREPVVASDGFTYERSAIQGWLSTGNTTSPVTGEKLISEALYPNHMLVLAMREWQLHQDSQPMSPQTGRPPRVTR